MRLLHQLAVACAAALLQAQQQMAAPEPVGLPGSPGFAERYKRSLVAEPEYPPFVPPAAPPRRRSRFQTPPPARNAGRSDVRRTSSFLEFEPSDPGLFTKDDPEDSGYLGVGSKKDASASDEFAAAQAAYEESKKFDVLSDSGGETKNSNANGKQSEDEDDKETHYPNVYCRCAPLACNCTKKCTCYVNPDGSRGRKDPTVGIAKAFMDGPWPQAEPSVSKVASSVKNFFQPFASFLENPETTSARQERDTCPIAPGNGRIGGGHMLRGTRMRTNGVREEWCVQGGRTQAELESNIAAAADEKRFSVLQLNTSYVNPEQLYHFGGDPEFRRVHTEQYICDNSYCTEMSCKCKKYCRCRGVPIPMFEGETDKNSRGIPVSFNGAGYWPWYPKLYTSCNSIWSSNSLAADLPPPHLPSSRPPSPLRI